MASSSLRGALVMASAIAFLNMAPRAARADLPPLIPRVVLFGNPEKTARGALAERKNAGIPGARLQPSVGDLDSDHRKTDDRVVASDPKRAIRSVQCR